MPTDTTISTPHTINLSLAAYPGFTHFQAMGTAANSKSSGKGLKEPLWGDLSLEHVQIVPQNFGVFGEEEAHEMRALYPGTKFRLHANVRVLQRRMVYDLSNFMAMTDWFDQAARVQKILGGYCYSAHAGYRANCTLDEMFDNARRASDLYGFPVAIEGLYPDPHKAQLLSTWPEYAALLESGLPFALDLSHLNIVATRTRKREDGLVKEMLNSENCLEIHVSDNDGTGDQHQVCTPDHTPWWVEIFQQAREGLTVFSEGNLRRKMELRPSRPTKPQAVS